MQPLVIGNLERALRAHICESTWDALTLCDSLGIDLGGASEDVLFCTRGAANGKFVDQIAEMTQAIYVWPQNDQPGQAWLRKVSETLHGPFYRVHVPAQHKDLNDWVRAGAISEELCDAIETADLVEHEKPENVSEGTPPFAERLGQEQGANAETEEQQSKGPLIEFLSPSEIKAYVPPPGTVLVGHNHIVRGGVFVIGGAPGVGKSRGTVALAEAGATKLEWLGLKVHSHFRTMVVQNENGRFRLQLEFAELDEKLLDQYVRVSPPPPLGMRFDRPDFRNQLKAHIESFQPGVIFIDPWNAVARDDKQKDYAATFDLVRGVIPAGDDAPAIGIIAHTRKPLPNERANGRALLNLLAGSYVLASVPRSVWVMQHATDDVSENRVVVTCCKNNDGELGNRSVWVRDNGLWTPYQGFDWDEWDNPDPDNKRQKTAITERSLAIIFEDGKKALTLSDARDALMKLTARKRSVCYAALDEKGKFADRLRYDRRTKLMRWVP